MFQAKRAADVPVEQFHERGGLREQRRVQVKEVLQPDQRLLARAGAVMADALEQFLTWPVSGRAGRVHPIQFRRFSAARTARDSPRTLLGSSVCCSCVGRCTARTCTVVLVAFADALFLPTLSFLRVKSAGAVRLRLRSRTMSGRKS